MVAELSRRRQLYIEQQAAAALKWKMTEDVYCKMATAVEAKMAAAAEYI